MKKTITSEITVCDVCGNECKPVNHLEIACSHFLSDATDKSIVVAISARTAAFPETDDVCRNCLGAALIVWLNCNDISTESLR